MGYFSEIAAQLGVSLWLLVVILIWINVWKFLALWKSARKNQVTWFVIFALVHTMGILEILYIYVFSEKTDKSTAKKKQTKLKRKKK